MNTKPIIETNRLILREFREKDAPEFHRLNGDNEVMKYTGDKAFESIDGALTLIQNYKNYEEDGYGQWTVVLKETNEVIG